MGDAPQCTAKSKRSGERCKKQGLARADGTYTSNCRMHGGTRQRAEPGDPTRLGRPPETFSYVSTVPEEFRSVYGAAQGELGKLEHELALARTNLYRFQQKARDQEHGGIPTSITSVASGGKHISLRTYADIVGEYLDRIARMEYRRARILEAVGGSESNDSDLLGHEEWLKAAHSRSRRRSSS
jgi:hypothetical protein